MKHVCTLKKITKETKSKQVECRNEMSWKAKCLDDSGGLTTSMVWVYLRDSAVVERQRLQL